MTTVTSTNNNVATNAVDQAKPQIGADFNMFLKLLTAQMQNQDPMDPMDTSQYTQQLVQYSQVEQSITQTATLKSILGSLGNQNLTQASALIGRTVEINSPVSGLTTAKPAQWNWTADRKPTSIVATITDATGKTVDTRNVEVNGATGEFSWDGKTSAGRQFDPGSYKVTFKGADALGNEIAVTPHALGLVSDVQLDNGNVLLTVNGAKVASTDLVRIGAQ